MIHFRIDAFLLGNPCCGGGSPILLPRQSSLGTYEGQHYQPTCAWPATFVCIQHERSFEVPIADIYRSDTEIPAPSSHQSKILWETECKCDRAGCSRSATIYAWCFADKVEVEIALGVLRANPRIVCTSDHHLEVRDGKMKLRRLGS